MAYTPRRSQQQDNEAEGSAFWLITYSDMTTLLLTFFLLMFSFTVMSDEAQHELLHQLNRVDAPKKGSDPVKEKASLEAIARDIAAQFKDREVFVEATESEVTVGLSNEVTFASGDATLSPAALDPLGKAATILARLPNAIRVEGHTDDVPIATARFPSNWHLSTARALAVLRFLSAQGVDPHRLQAVGYGAVRPRVPNESAPSRAANRRIEIKLVRE